jgi:hypothetical protein
MVFKTIMIIIISILSGSHTCPIKTDEEYNAITDFSNFKDLNFTDCYIPLQNVLTIEIRPNKQIILDDTLNLTGLKIASNNLYFGFMFTNIRGIDLNSTSLLLRQIELNQNLKKKTNFNFILSNFHFYFHNELIDKKFCDQKYFYYSKDKNSGYWKNAFLLAEIKFLFLKKTVKFSELTCPLVFNSLDIQLFAIEKLSCSFISKNMLGFYDIQPNNSLKFKKPLIFQFSAKLYHVDLKQTFLNEMIFEKLIVLDFYGQINSIQNDLFKKLYSLKMIRFHTQNAKSLLTNNNKWLKYLNNKIYLDPIDIEYMLLNDDKMFILSILQTFSDLTFYDYPEEDFCYFKNFPHKNFVLPELKPNYKSSCSCTEFYLIQYSVYFDEIINYYSNSATQMVYFLENFFNNSYDISHCVNSSKYEIIEKCNFKKRLDNCEIKGMDIKKSSQLDWDMIDWIETSQYTYLTFNLYVNPIFAFFCFLINILNIIILKSKSLKKDIQNNYNYFKLHSMSNLIFIILIPFELITNCVFLEFFCSAFYGSLIAQYFDKIFLKLFKNSLKTFSNISYLAFILIRYINITNTKNVHLKRFQKLKYRYYIFFTVIISLLLNIYIYFEYRFIGKDQREKLYSKIDDIESILSLDNLKIDLTDTEYMIFTICQYFKIIISDLFFFILSIIIDVVLIFFIQKSINKLKTNSTLRNTKNIELKKNSKSRLMSMVILNGINFLLLRFPLAIIDFYSLIFRLDKNANGYMKFKPDLFSFTVCRVFLICEDLKNIFITLNLISFFVQFFIFYKLDKNFQTGLTALFKRN